MIGVVEPNCLASSDVSLAKVPCERLTDHTSDLASTSSQEACVELALAPNSSVAGLEALRDTESRRVRLYLECSVDLVRHEVCSAPHASSEPLWPSLVLNAVLILWHKSVIYKASLLQRQSEARLTAINSHGQAERAGRQVAADVFLKAERRRKKTKKTKTKKR